ncbi:hypothetical protein VTN49DRAFT_2038 [Thermomyces lanuginosus]|uniref:uncharacterized protein n=1 Tax=Thermomyces lanuginosus TaxID=5541 RepID=UPI00374206E8
MSEFCAHLHQDGAPAQTCLVMCTASLLDDEAWKHWIDVPLNQPAAPEFRYPDVKRPKSQSVESPWWWASIQRSTHEYKETAILPGYIQVTPLSIHLLESESVLKTKNEFVCFQKTSSIFSIKMGMWLLLQLRFFLPVPFGLVHLQINPSFDWACPGS